MQICRLFPTITASVQICPHFSFQGLFHHKGVLGGRRHNQSGNQSYLLSSSDSMTIYSYFSKTFRKSKSNKIFHFQTGMDEINILPRNHELKLLQCLQIIPNNCCFNTPSPYFSFRDCFTTKDREAYETQLFRHIFISSVQQ